MCNAHWDQKVVRFSDFVIAQNILRSLYYNAPIYSAIEKAYGNTVACCFCCCRRSRRRWQSRFLLIKSNRAFKTCSHKIPSIFIVTNEDRCENKHFARFNRCRCIMWTEHCYSIKNNSIAWFPYRICFTKFNFGYISKYVFWQQYNKWTKHWCANWIFIFCIDSNLLLDLLLLLCIQFSPNIVNPLCSSREWTWCKIAVYFIYQKSNQQYSISWFLMAFG